MTLLNQHPVIFISKYAPAGFIREIDGRLYASPDVYQGLKQMIELRGRWPRIRHLPEDEQGPFEQWLGGKTCPWLDEEDDADQDGYYLWDYKQWQEGYPSPLG